MNIYSPKRNRINGIDGLKAIAITGVTLFHMFPETVQGGYLGVSLFFVLSGYLLAYNSHNQVNSGRFNILSYYIKRINRIYPSLIIMLLMTMGIYSFLAPDAIEAVRNEIFSVLLGYNNWWQISQNADYFTRLINTSPFTHLWFLGIELQFYAAWPLFLLIYILFRNMGGENFGIGSIALLGIAAAAIMPMLYQPDTDVTRLYYGTDTRVYALLFGAVLGFWKANITRKLSVSSITNIISYIVFISLLAITLISFALLDGQNPLVYQGGMLAITIAFCLMTILAADSRFTIGILLDNPLFSWIGKRSYGIFLWQYPVIYLFSYLKLTQLAFYPVLEIAIILLLTICSDYIADLMTTHKLPNISNNIAFATAQYTLIILTAISLIGIAGVGCHAIAMSKDDKSAIQSELQAKLEKNANDLQKTNAAAAVQEKPAEPVQISLDGAVCIGDSVMLGASSEIHQMLPNSYIDAEVSRYVNGGIPIVEDLIAQGKLGNLVVIALGTNGPIAGQERYEVCTKKLIEDIGPNRQIFWVNIYGPSLTWQDTNNNYIAKMAAEHSNIHVVDWYNTVAPHTKEWLGGDNIHPNDTGSIEYAKLIHDCMVKVLTEQAEKNKK